MADPYYEEPVNDEDPEAAQADALAAELSGDGVSVSEIDIAPDPVDSTVYDEYAVYDELAAQPSASEINTSAEPVTNDWMAEVAQTQSDSTGSGAFSSLSGLFGFGDSPASSQIQEGVRQAKEQQTLSDQTSQQASSADWRLRISLAKGSGYLYNAPQPGILQPLQPTNGVIFPYTPKIDLSYKANYQSYDMTHSNFRGYYYQNSNVGDISITGHFTAQNTLQANYLLAVIHFFRSATKMFYGQDAQRGTPPPLVFMSGLGQYQFNNHPCLITEFTYSLPEDVDYLRAGVVNNVGLNASTISNVLNSTVAAGGISGYARLAAAFTTPGALPETPFGSLATATLAPGNPTYVPTKMDITIRLLPVQTRAQASKQFSVKNFANGNLLRGGFW